MIETFFNPAALFIPLDTSAARTGNTESGKYLRGIGDQPGTKPGEFLAPHGIAINSHGHLFVVDAYNHRIQKFDVSNPKPADDCRIVRMTRAT